MDRLRKHYLVPLLMVLILGLLGLALMFNVLSQTRRLRAETIFLSAPLQPAATAPQRLVTPEATYPPVGLDLVQAAMRANEPGADLRGRTEGLVSTLEAPVPTVAGGPTWTPSPVPEPTDAIVLEMVDCDVLTSGWRLRTEPLTESPARGMVNVGDQVVATGRSSDDNWAVVSSPEGIVGWVQVEALACVPSIDNLMVVEP